jgi:hypothetical protein
MASGGGGHEKTEPPIAIEPMTYASQEASAACSRGPYTRPTCPASAIYHIALSAHYHQAFHDITRGNNTSPFPSGTITGYQGAPGWAPVTGWGSPDAQVLVPLLARTA